MPQIMVETLSADSVQSFACRRGATFPAVLAVSLAYLMFLVARRNISDPDLWWHLRNAQQLLATHHLPVVDSYSYTAAGAPVLPFEWLAETAYFVAFQLAGLTAVFLLVFVLSAFVVLGIFRLALLAGAEVKNSFLVCVAAAVMTAVSAGARTLLFGWACLVALLLMLELVRRGNLRWLWLVPPLFALWINLHASWPMGLVVLAIFIGGGLMEGTWGNVEATRWSPHELRALVLTGIASAAAVFANPFGYRLVIYPFPVIFGAKLQEAQIQEFAQVDFQSAWGKIAILLIASVLATALFSRVRWRPDEFATVMLALYFALSHVRFMYLAAILLTPILARRLSLMVPYKEASDRPLPNAIALAVIAVLFVFSMPRASALHGVISYPSGALQYLEDRGVHDRVFNDWGWGGYILWHDPQLKVFIDGRGDPYSANGVVADYVSAMSNVNTQAVLDKYRVQYVLIPPKSAMAQALTGSNAWRVVYRESTDILFERARE